MTASLDHRSRRPATREGDAAPPRRRVAPPPPTTVAAAPRLPRLLGVQDVAARLAVSTKSVRRWITRGDLPVHRLGRQLRVAEDDLLVFLNRARR
jgi:excisionase family DNA binding protein